MNDRLRPDVPVFWSPAGDPEVWEEKPAGYFDSYEEWAAAHPELVPAAPAFNPGPDYVERDGEWWKVRFTKLAFRQLFTINEKAAIKAVIAGGNHITASIYDDLLVADFIDVTDPATVAALGALASDIGGNVVTPERAAEILTGKKLEDAI